MEAASSPSTCLSLSSDFLTSPANSVVSSSHVGSWPNSCNSSPKRGFAAAAANSSSSCPSSPTKRFHWDSLDPAAAAAAVDCTLSLGNALTRSRSSELPEPPNRLSRAGSPIAEPVRAMDHPKLGVGSSSSSHQQSPSWATSSELLLQQQRTFSAEAAARRIAAAAAAARFTPTSSEFYVRHPVLNSPQFPAAGFSPTKFGFLEFNTVGGGGGGGYGSGGKNNLDLCSTRSRFRGVDAHVDPRNVPRICAHCGTSSTPLWRNGPLGPKSLCNACGIRFKKVGRRSPVPVTPVTAAAWNQSSCDQQHHLVKDANFSEHQLKQAVFATAPKPAVVLPAQAYEHDKQRHNSSIASSVVLPFAREWSSSATAAAAAADQSPCSSNAVGSSCITWQDSMPSAVCVDQPSSEDRSRVAIAAAGGVRRPPALVLDAEVIRTVSPVNTVTGHGQSKEEQGRFLRMSL